LGESESDAFLHRGLHEKRAENSDLLHLLGGKRLQARGGDSKKENVQVPIPVTKYTEGGQSASWTTIMIRIRTGSYRGRGRKELSRREADGKKEPQRPKQAKWQREGEETRDLFCLIDKTAYRGELWEQDLDELSERGDSHCLDRSEGRSRLTLVPGKREKCAIELCTSRQTITQAKKKKRRQAGME